VVTVAGLAPTGDNQLPLLHHRWLQRDTTNDRNDRPARWGGGELEGNWIPRAGFLLVLRRLQRRRHVPQFYGGVRAPYDCSRVTSGTNLRRRRSLRSPASSCR
jgi:hypothetical protein